jgi:RHS repeat-associated protein
MSTFTLEFWEMADASTTNNGGTPPVGITTVTQDSDPSVSGEFMLHLQSGDNSLYEQNPSGTVYEGSGSSGSFTTDADDGGWHYVVITRTSGGPEDVYVDSQLVDSFTAPSFAQPISGFDLYGTVANVALYSTALSAAQVLSHYEAQNTASSATWPATLGQGGALRQASGCSTTIGSETVDCASGDLSTTATDTNVPGPGGGLVLTRTYNSLDVQQPASWFGSGWSCSYCWRLQNDGEGDVIITEGDGSDVVATANGSGGYTIAGIYDSSLTENEDGSWTFIPHQGSTYEFNPGGQLTAITDLNGYTTTLTYTTGDLSSITDADGQSLTVTTNDLGLISSISDPLGLETSYTYNGQGLLATVTNQDGDEWQYGYNAAGYMTSLTDPDGKTQTTTFDSQGRAVTQTEANTAETQYSYSGDPFSSAGGTTVITDPDGHEAQQDYTSGQLMSYTAGYGTSGAETWNYTYDANGCMLTETDPNTYETIYTCDSHGNVMTKTDPLGREWQWTYNSFDEVTMATGPQWGTTTNTYNSNGDLLTSSTPIEVANGNLLGTSETQYTYGNSSLPGYPTAVEDANDHTTNHTYDSDGRLTSTTNPLGDKTSYTYDADGRMLTEVSPDGNVSGCGCASSHTTTYTYNALSEPLTETNADGYETTYTYDADGNKTSTTLPDGSKTVTTYNSVDEPTEVQIKNSGGTVQQTTSTGYDADGNVSSQTDGDGNETTYSYNALNEKISTTNPESGTTSYTYDPAGNLATETTGGGIATYGYDHDNELTSITYSSPTSGFASAPNVTYSYDSGGRRTGMTDGTGTSSWTYYSNNDMESYTDGAGATVRYAYDLEGNQTSITYPDGTTVSQTFNAGDQLATIGIYGTIASFEYDADGNVTSAAYDDGTTDTSTYDPDDNLLSTSIAGPYYTYASMTYTYNQNGEVASETDTGLPGPVTQNYTYDALQQLSDAKYNQGVYGQPYSDNPDAYDQSGNPTTVGGNSGFTYSSDEELTAAPASADPKRSSPEPMSYVYDALGDRIEANSTVGGGNDYYYAYNQEGELTGLATSNDSGTYGSYTYNGDGLRMSKSVNGTTTQFTYDTTGGTPLLLTDGTHDYIYGPDGLPIYESGVGYLHHDQLGSIRMISNGSPTSTFTYNPNGTLNASTGTATTPFGYAGQYTDPETGLIYLDHRYYDPYTNQFITVDPQASQTQQPYQYADDDPLNNADPTGLDDASLGEKEAASYAKYCHQHAKSPACGGVSLKNILKYFVAPVAGAGAGEALADVGIEGFATVLKDVDPDTIGAGVRLVSKVADHYVPQAETFGELAADWIGAGGAPALSAAAQNTAWDILGGEPSLPIGEMLNKVFGSPVGYP